MRGRLGVVAAARSSTAEGGAGGRNCCVAPPLFKVCLGMGCWNDGGMEGGEGSSSVALIALRLRLTPGLTPRSFQPLIAIFESYSHPNQLKTSSDRMTDAIPQEEDP